MTASLTPARRRALLAVVVLAVLVVSATLFPWRLLRGPLESYIAHALKRDVTIETLDVDFGRITRLQLENVKIANAAWSANQPMAQAERVVFFFSLGSLLRGEPDYIQLAGPDVLLERNAEGDTNWIFEGDADRWPLLSAVDVDHGTVRYRDPTLKTDVTATLQTQAAEGQGSSLRFMGRGTVRGEAFALDGRSAGLVALRRTGDPYQVTLNVRAGKTELDFDGTIVPGDPENVRGALQVRGPDLSKLYPFVPSPLPWTPPYSLKGELAHTKGMWIFRRFRGTVGDSDLAGNFQVVVSTRRPKTIADLTSSRFHYKDLGGLIGLPPAAPMTAEQQKEAARRSASDRLLPDKTFDLVKLREHDADVKFRGTAVRFGSTPIDNLRSHVKLQDGVMRLEPLDFGIGEGHVVSNVTLDVNRPTAVADAQVEVRGVELKRLFPKLASPNGTAGRFGGRARLHTQGNSIAAMAAALDGDAALLMRGGEASTLQLVLTNLDLARAAALLLRGDEAAEIRCAVAAVHVQQGIVKPDFLVIDTSAVVITGEGSVDLRDEKFDLELTAKSKQPSLVALRGPIVLDGTFAHPNARPALGQVGVRIGAAVGLGALSPPLALLPLIDFGGAEDVDCGAIVAQARVQTGTTERIARAKNSSSAKAKAKGKAKSSTPTAVAADRSPAPATATR
ncbi:MAG: AsmA family protein [Casimicrobiaceae bacterium]